MLGTDPVRKLLEMREKYGNVFRFDIGFMPSVIFMGYEEVAEAEDPTVEAKRMRHPRREARMVEATVLALLVPRLR